MIDTSSESYRKLRSETRHALSAPLTDRSLHEYEQEFGFKVAELGKKVLDLGSGTSERFAREARQYGVNVTSVNPQLIDPDVRRQRKILGGETTHVNSVAALAQNLPFPNETFDSVVSFYAVPMHLREAEYTPAILEIHRVLKTHGNAYIGPVIKPELDILKQIFIHNNIVFGFKEAPTNKQLKTLADQLGAPTVDTEYNITILK